MIVHNIYCFTDAWKKERRYFRTPENERTDYSSIRIIQGDYYCTASLMDANGTVKGDNITLDPRE